jgi:hypothetical protein
MSRFSPDELVTIQEDFATGVPFGVTRERVRQIATKGSI